MGKLVTYLVKDGIAEITINHPPVNAMNDQVFQELDEAIEAVKAEEAGAVIVIGAGEKAFVAGADISEFPYLDGEGGYKLSVRGQRVFDKIAELPVPAIAAVNGFALGAGLELALCCDIRIASENAKLGLPETNLALIPGYAGTQRLARLVGSGKAKEMVFTAEHISAEEALQIGLVQKVASQGEVMDAARSMAQKIIIKGPLAIRSAKKAIDEGLKVSLQEGQEIEAKHFGALFDTEDQKEGAKAFLEKRKPEFKGK